MKFTYQNSTLIEFGEGKISKIKELISKDKKVLIIYGGGSIKRNGLYNQVIEALDEHKWFEFGGIEPNPTKETLDKAVSYARENDIDFILAVGGGSVIDGCKYIINSYFYDGDGWDLLEGKYSSTKALELGVILTLAATGSESNGAAVITRKSTNEKRFFVSEYSYPKFSILDPDVLKSLDDRQLSNGLVDSFVHVCEQYLTLKHDCLVQDSYSEGLLRTLITLINNYDKKDNNWYSNLMWTANQALNGLIGVGVPQDWGTHFIGHEISGLYGLDHARTLAIVQPNLLRTLIKEKEGKLIQMGKNVFNLDTNIPEDTIVAIEKLYKSLNVDLKLSSYIEDTSNVKEEITDLLHKHGFDNFGTNGTIDKDLVLKILDKSI